MNHPRNKIISLEEAVRWRNQLRAYFEPMVCTNGCFDVLHRGHLELLIGARQLGDGLLVLVNSDASVRWHKGPSRPINSELDRALALACMRMVDRVVIFEGSRCARELAALAPDVYVKSAEYRDRQDPEELAALKAAGTRLHFLELLRGYSTTATLAKLHGGPVA
jgi:rfaE bifunctional protein nucleotidyltransferase chain/domain